MPDSEQEQTPSVTSDPPSAGTVPITPDQARTLQNLADSQNIDVSDALGQAIKIAKIIVDVNNNSNERVLIQKGQQLQELTLK
jgi:hypothetical protein